MIELDVHTCVDGQWWCIHDPDTERTTGEKVRVAEATLARLRS